MRWKILAAVCMLVLSIGAYAALSQNTTRETATNQNHGQLEQLPRQASSIGEARLSLYVATNSAQTTKGLSDSAELPAGTGMLFYLPSRSRLGFWMKDMNYPIDMLWLDSRRQVVHLEPSVSPDTYPQSFSNPVDKPAEYVLELNNGDVERYGISLGDELKLHEPILDHLPASTPSASDTDW